MIFHALLSPLGTLSLIDRFLPRITLSKRSKGIPSALPTENIDGNTREPQDVDIPPTHEPQTTPTSGAKPEQDDPKGFMYLKRDLVRLLGILAHRSKAVQDRVRLCEGIPVVLNMCVMDERNPCKFPELPFLFTFSPPSLPCFRCAKVTPRLDILPLACAFFLHLSLSIKHPHLIPKHEFSHTCPSRSVRQFFLHFPRLSKF